METNAHRPRQGGTFRPHRLCLPLLAACLLLPVIAQADPPLYRVTSLGELSGDPETGSSEAYALNDLGQVVGETLIEVQGSHPVHAFLWLPVDAYGLGQGMHDLGLLPGGGLLTGLSEARDINETGQVVGTSDATGGARAFLWFPEHFHDFPFQQLWPLPRFEENEETEGWALADGDPLHVVGWGLQPVRSPDPRLARDLGFLWTNSNPGSLVPIEPPVDNFNWTDSMIFAINPNPNPTNRLVLGGMADWGGAGVPPFLYIAMGQDYLDGHLVKVSLSLPGPFGGPYSKARDVTDEGELVGWGKDEDNQSLQRALYWETVTSAPVNLHTVVGPPLPPGDATLAEAIARPLPDGLPNVVGWNDATERALLWKRDSQGQWSVEDLNELIGTHAQDDWLLVEAHDINNNAWIVGWGLYGAYPNQKHRAILLSTAKDCPADLDFDGDVDTGDLLILLGNWGYCPEGEICWSDIDMDGDVDTADLLFGLLANWGECGGGGGEVPRNVQDCIDKFGFDPVALEACIQAVTGGLE